MKIGVLTIHLMLPGSTSLKEKRGRLKPFLSRIHREFNVAAAEIDHQDRWQEAVVAVAAISNENAQTQRILQSVLHFCERQFTDLEIIENHIEII